MKYLVILLLMILSCNSIVAQERIELSYWTGTSSNPDPIMRHHEAFMEAFIQYVKSRPMTAEGSMNDTMSDGPNSCRVETVASVTHNGCEVLTISIGAGPKVNYTFCSESSTPSSATVDKTILRILRIEYNDFSKRNEQKAIHEYRQYSYIRKDISDKTTTTTTEFDYTSYCQQKVVKTFLMETIHR